MIFWLGVIFELPLAMFLLAKLRIISHRGFRKFRKYVPAAAFVLSAIITPTFDLVNSTLVAVPIIVLFEVGLVLSWLAEGRAGAVVRKVKAIAVWVLRRPVVAFKAAWRRCVRLWRWIDPRRLLGWREG
jgi:sec-independent protein translocase protein TatC